MRQLQGYVVLFVLFFGITFESSAQSILLQGSDETLDVGTWNIEWFGYNDNGPQNLDLQLSNVVRIVRESQIDVWAVQEIASTAQWQRLLDELGDEWDGAVAETAHSGTQRIGFLYRTSVIRPTEINHILTDPLFRFDFAGRPPLEMRADVTLPDTTFPAIFIVLHMKCCNDTVSGKHAWERRRDAAGWLKNRIDFTGFYRDPVIILGDYNDLVWSSTRAGFGSPYQAFRDDNRRYWFVTEDAELRGEFSYCATTTCSRGSMIDHIMVTNELFEPFVTGSARPFTEVVSAISSYRTTTSDHMPVIARFSFDTRTSITELPGAISTFSLSAPYPNPTYGDFRLSLQTSRAENVAIDIVDLMGRIVFSYTASTLPGETEIALDLGSVATGIYMIRANSGMGSETTRLAIIR
jgi:endonuclease/exonuclease/phosphatase family metal-dependent hydrolase